jgi:predicted TIM-barrel fold metal-dependent hydrolase
VHPLVETCREQGGVVYAHTGTPITSEPFQLAELARTFPDVSLVLGHMGFTDFWYDAAPAALQSQNIYLETSLIDIMNIAHAIERVGARRILFGSDFPETDLSLEVEKMEMLEIGEAQRRSIMSDNALALWGGRT